MSKFVVIFFLGLARGVTLKQAGSEFPRSSSEYKDFLKGEGEKLKHGPYKYDVWK